MARLLLVPLALILLAASAAPFGMFLWLGGDAIRSALHDPALRSAWPAALRGAALAAFGGVALGLPGALALSAATRRLRAAGYALAVLLLAVPGPGFTGLGVFVWPPDAALLGLAASAARACGFTVLILGAALRRVPPGLLRSAMAAGATPLRAWQDAVLAPLAMPLLAAFALAMLAGLAASPAALAVGAHFDLNLAWIGPAALLLAAGSAAGLAHLLGPPGRRM